MYTGNSPPPKNRSKVGSVPLHLKSVLRGGIYFPMQTRSGHISGVQVYKDMQLRTVTDHLNNYI